MRLSIAKRFSMVIIIISLVAFGVTISLLTYQSFNNLQKLSLENAKNLAEKNANYIQGELEAALACARTIAETLEGNMVAGNYLTRPQVNEMLKNVLIKNPKYLGVYVGFEPDAFDQKDAQFLYKPGHDQTGRFIPYWNRLAGQINFEPLLNYQQEGIGDYYLLPKRLNQEVIIDPVVYKGVLKTSLVVPINNREGQFIGIAGVDLNLYPFNDKINQNQALESGYTFLLSNKGIYASHPNELLIGYARPDNIDVNQIRESILKGNDDYIQQFATPEALEKLAEFAKEQKLSPQTQKQLLESVATGREGINEVYDAHFGKDAYWVNVPIKVGQTSTPWSSVVSLPKEVVFGPASEMVKTGAAVSLLSILVLCLALGIAVKRLVKPVLVINDTLKQLATGDLTINFEANREDEIGELANELNLTVQQISNLVLEIVESANRVERASLDIASVNHDLSERTQEQASTLEEIAATIEEINSSAQQTAANTNQADQLSHSTLDAVKAGESSIQQTMEAMNQISNSSKQIAEIIKVVNDIAFQTNLLALNAAVEAARAGEQGRGFAVVAAEVRNLAGRTAESAREIEYLIKESTQRVEKGNLLVQQSAQMLEQIVINTKRTSDVITEVSSAMKEQSSATQQIQVSIEQLNQVTQQNALMVEEMSASSHSLNLEAKNLDDKVNQFKINLQVGLGQELIEKQPAKILVSNEGNNRDAEKDLAEDGWEKF